MTSLKAGTLFALTFASGGGAGVYWSTANDSKHDASPADNALSDNALSDNVPSNDAIEGSATRAAHHDAQRPQHAQRPHNGQETVVLRSMPHSGEEVDEDHPEARSAADILWALEQAYQNQEQRILQLEAALQDQIQDDNEEQEESGHEAHASLHAPGDSDVMLAEVGPPPVEAAAHRHEPQVVVNINQPVERAAMQDMSAAQVAQQVLVLNHYQPVFVSDQPFAPTFDGGLGLGPSTTSNLLERRRKMGQGSQQGFQQSSTANSSWVASGFDVYTKR